ncbi:hydroxyisourate hydrolase [Nakamurella endophytica]|uniref:5-hydroxyisourate hydrolase n=1 Tax=Nakamurella endophytica TaxID=1748367 RepID=A0A917WKM2_9ACTN|nr:hydroxyisourate hydrolase [Nakamurella endophytica]GGM11134.1 5-hydroxyisourate hydrolase [Nakamurella endophytica]
MTADERTGNRLSTHVLDTVAGRPADGIAVRLDRCEGDGSVAAGSGTTDADGRIPQLGTDLVPGIYRLTFDTGPYLRRVHGSDFYPRVTVEFRLDAARAHHHVPLLLGTYHFSTYLGS